MGRGATSSLFGSATGTAVLLLKDIPSPPVEHEGANGMATLVYNERPYEERGWCVRRYLKIAAVRRCPFPMIGL